MHLYCTVQTLSQMLCEKDHLRSYNQSSFNLANKSKENHNSGKKKKGNIYINKLKEYYLVFKTKFINNTPLHSVDPQEWCQGLNYCKPQS